jgi:hypothetical protein
MHVLFRTPTLRATASRFAPGVRECKGGRFFGAFDPASLGILARNQAVSAPCQLWRKSLCYCKITAPEVG